MSSEYTSIAAVESYSCLSILMDTVSSSSNVSTNYSWEVGDGFSITPEYGSLPPRQSVQLQATFSPSKASVYQKEAVCKFIALKREDMKCMHNFNYYLL